MWNVFAKNMGLNLNYAKRATIKWLMKLFERSLSRDDYHLSEIFRQDSFTHAIKQERERIMLKSSERAYLDELAHPLDSVLEGLLRLIDHLVQFSLRGALAIGFSGGGDVGRPKRLAGPQFRLAALR